MIRFAGYVHVELRDARGRLKRALAFHNLVTDAALNLIGVPDTGGWNISTAWFATSSNATVPAVTDTTLAGEVAGNRSNTKFGADTAGLHASPEYFFYNTTRQFAPGIATGTIAKVAVFTASAGGTMLFEALLLDANGTPTTLTKLAGDTVNISWQVRAIPPAGDVVQNITIAGIAYTITQRACGINTGHWGNVPSGGFRVLASQGCTTSAAGMVARTTAPPTTGGGAARSNVTWAPYVAGSFTIVGTFVPNTFSPNVIYFGYDAFTTNASQNSGSQNEMFQVGITPVIPNGQSTTISFTWGRA